MSNSFKIKKPKTKEETVEVKDSKHGASFMKNKREKGTIQRTGSGKTNKDYSRKKT